MRRPQRLATFDYVGKHRYFLTCCVAERRAAFTSKDRVDCVRAEFLRTCGERQFEEIVTVYMPDHVHMLLRGLSDDAAFRPFFRLFRRRSSIAYRQLVRQALWQDGYFDRILRPYEDSMRIVDYIVNNPVRARLVERPGDYPYVFVRQP